MTCLVTPMSHFGEMGARFLRTYIIIITHIPIICTADQIENRSKSISLNYSNDNRNYNRKNNII